MNTTYKLIQADTEQQAQNKLTSYAEQHVQNMRDKSKELRNITLNGAVIETTL
jgi:hypothetical protein